MNSRTTERWKTPTKRAFERFDVAVPARLTWKDRHGTTRFASVMTRNASETGVFVDCRPELSIPLYRLALLQIERDTPNQDGIPAPLRRGRVLAAVYRLTPPTPDGAPQGLALRLMVEPARRRMETAPRRATA
jgi:hypothetical protein